MTEFTHHGAFIAILFHSFRWASVPTKPGGMLRLLTSARTSPSAQDFLSKNLHDFLTRIAGPVNN